MKVELKITQDQHQIELQNLTGIIENLKTLNK